MLTGEIRNQVDRARSAFWSRGMSNPLEVIEPWTLPPFRAMCGEP